MVTSIFFSPPFSEVRGKEKEWNAEDYFTLIDIKISLKRKIFSLKSHWQSVAKLTMLPRGSRMSPAVTISVNTVVGNPVFLKGPHIL